MPFDGGNPEQAKILHELWLPVRVQSLQLADHQLVRGLFDHG